MATQTTNIPGSGYGNVYLDSLIWGAAWTDIATPIRYWFGEGSTVAPSDLSGVAFDGETWDAPEKDAFIAVTHQYEAVCNLKFVEAGSAADADIVWWKAPGWVMVDSKGIPILAMHQVPDAVNQQINGYFNYETPSWAHLAPGQDGYWMVLHELGHGMGLAHPHDGGSETDATKFPGVRKAFFSDTYTTGTNGLNQTIWTVMSYNQGWNQEQAHQTYGQAGTLMAFDIAALQALYGANMSTATGPDTYQLPATLGPGTYWESIWDAGGFDTISNSGSAQACTIDLRAAPLTGANAAGYVSYIPGIPGGFTIANGVVIENALGGLANDVLIGNAANNDLFGGDGNDTMSGGEGNDELWGAGGGDTLTGGRGADYFWYGDTGETGVGVGLRDVITDFKAAQGDTIILLYLDAVVGTADHEAFIYIGAAAFSAAGQLRFENGILSGETTGDGVADFEIHLSGVRNFDGTGLNL